MNKLFLALVLSFTVVSVNAKAGTMTSEYAAAVAYVLENGGYVDEFTLDAYNTFVMDAGDKHLRQFVKARAKLDANYDPKKDCLNPDLTSKEYAKECS